jgi:hypothetical protein
VRRALPPGRETRCGEHEEHGPVPITRRVAISDAAGRVRSPRAHRRRREDGVADKQRASGPPEIAIASAAPRQPRGARWLREQPHEHPQRRREERVGTERPQRRAERANGDGPGQQRQQQPIGERAADQKEERAQAHRALIAPAAAQQDRARHTEYQNRRGVRREQRPIAGRRPRRHTADEGGGDFQSRNGEDRRARRQQDAIGIADGGGR